MRKKKTDDAQAPEGEAKGGRKKLLVIVAVALVAIGAGAWFLLFSGDDGSEPVAGEVLPLESIAVNLAGGGYLKVGNALQLTEDAAGGGHGGAAVDGSQALDLVISTFSQAQPTDVTTARDALKESLRHQIVEAYTDHEAGTQMVMDIYFTEYVTQ